MAEYNEEVWELLKSRLDKPYSVLDATLNPESNTHWLKTNFLDTIEDKEIDAYTQTYTIFDNSFLDETFVKNLCNEYEGTIEMADWTVLRMMPVLSYEAEIQSVE